ncbi:MAG TPA: PIN domain-containing protein [Vicinamibacterales bacterium]|nr:PIN domain-containing protein [Vicinamibacterales bacterium]
MVLVDTSVWIEVFRKSARVDLESLVDFDDVVTCLPVIQEVLQGFDSESAFMRARESMLALPIVESPLRVDVYFQSVDLYRSGRRAGFTIRSSVDCVIAACAIRHQLEVLHHDRDFDSIARISPLRARNIAKRRS